MTWLRSFVKLHRVSGGIGLVMLIGGYWAGRELTRPLPTSFLVQGDTTAATFTALEQTESRSQAGLFASPETPVNLVISCSKLQHIGPSHAGLACRNGYLKLEHVYLEALRLGQNTRISLLVADRNLDVILTQTSGEDSLVTLLFDSYSKVSGAQLSSDKGVGEWTTGSVDGVIHLTFFRPRFHSGDDEGGQKLSPGTAFAFQSDGRSGFLNDTGLLSIAGMSSENRRPLNGDLLQVYSVQSGEVRTLSPIVAPDGSLSGLRVEFHGTSGDIQTINPLKDKPSNHALSRAERITGIHITLKAICEGLVGLLSVSYGVMANIKTVHGHHKSSVTKTRERTL